MKKTFKLFKKVFGTIFVALALVVTTLFASCDNTPKYAVDWTGVSEHVTLAVEGYEELPTEVKENTVLVFTVTPDSGYEILNVKVNSKTEKADNGKYSVTVTSDTKISVAADRKVSSIEVTSNPTKLTYYAGESLDVTGMVVTVKYETGESEVIERGTSGYAVSPSVFEGGETSFKVIHGSHEQVVNLTSKVEFLVTVDPAGGVLDQTWVSSIASLELNNYAVSESGVVTFSYFENLPSEITLPNASRENYQFLGWGDAATTITNETGNVSATARWQAELVVIEAAELVLEEGVPYLVVTGTYKLANSVYLFLYEGNAQISLKGDTYENTAGTVGAPFECKFDLRKLAAAETEDGGTFEGKWMDIRFNAVIGETEESMEINVGSGSPVSVNLSQIIEAEGKAYTFETYADALKVYYNLIHYSYELSFEQREVTKVVDEVETTVTVDALVITGSAPLYKEANIEITWWNGSAETTPDVSEIDADGNFEIVIDVTDREKIQLDYNAFAHVHIYTDDGETLYGGTSEDLKIINCKTEIPAIVKGTAGGDITHAIRHEDANGIAYYAGNAWAGLMLYAKNERQVIDYSDVEIEYVDGVVYYTVNGNVEGFDQSELVFDYDFQHNSNIDGKGWEYPYDATELLPVTSVADGKYSVRVPASTLLGQQFIDSGDEMWALTVHLAKDVAKDLKPAAIDNLTYAVKDGVKYSLRMDGNTWSIAALVMEKTEEADGLYVADTITYENASIAEVEGKAIVTVTGSYTGYTAEEIKSGQYIDLQKNPYRENGGTSWDGDWTRDYLTGTIEAADGKFSFSFDVTDLGEHSYTIHGCVGASHEVDAGPDLKVPVTIDAETEGGSVTIGAKKYQLISAPGSGDGKLFWGCLGLDILAA